MSEKDADLVYQSLLPRVPRGWEWSQLPQLDARVTSPRTEYRAFSQRRGTNAVGVRFDDDRLLVYWWTKTTPSLWDQERWLTLSDPLVGEKLRELVLAAVRLVTSGERERMRGT